MSSEQVGEHVAEETMSLVDASEHLGLATSTLRRWIKNGRLEATRIARPQGGYEWQVPRKALASTRSAHVRKRPGRADGVSMRSSHPGVAQSLNGHPGEQSLGIAELAALVRERDAAMREKDEKVTQLAGQVGFLQAQLQQAQEQVKLLQAPPDDEPAPQRRWWRKVWRWGR